MKTEIPDLSIKQSYFNILALFMETAEMDTRYVKCLLKWGVQLGVDRDDLDAIGKRLQELAFAQPQGRVERLEAIYHLVEMIYLDNTIEDVELEIASIYAERLGFRKEIVGDLFKSIATRDYDGVLRGNMRDEVVEFLRVAG